MNKHSGADPRAFRLRTPLLMCATAIALMACGGGSEDGYRPAEVGNLSAEQATGATSAPSPAVATMDDKPIDASASVSEDGLTTDVAPAAPPGAHALLDDVADWMRQAISPPIQPEVRPSAALLAEQSRRADITGVPAAAANDASPAITLRAPVSAAVLAKQGLPANNPGQVGAWDAPQKWPLIAIHAALLPDGRVVTYGTSAAGQQTGSMIYDIWDSSAASQDTGHLTLANGTPTDLFCNAQVLLSRSGELFLAGGDRFVNGATTNSGNNNSVIFDPATNSLRSGTNLNRARWYGTVTTLADEQTFIMGGRGGTDRPEVRDANGRFTLLDAAETDEFDFWYPRNFLTEDDRIFGLDVFGRMFYVDPRDRGFTQRLSNLNSDFMGVGSSAAMFEPGQILQVGGNSARVARISINHPVPRISETTATSSARFWGTTTVLPDGKVLVTGGSAKDNKLEGVNNNAELWDPTTGQWTVGASGTLPRLYHSTALLLPDASVLVAGGGAPGPMTNTNAERYYPPYLFDDSGARAKRPRITYAPDDAVPGQQVTIGVANDTPIATVALVRAGSVTHSFNFDQRRLVLAHRQDGNVVTAHLPTNGAEVPPGFYMVFALDSNGVPSEASMLRIGQGRRADIHADWIGAIGGARGNGRDFAMECEGDAVLVGIHGRAGNSLASIGPQCVRVDASGRWAGTPTDSPAMGGDAGTSYAHTCPRDHAVVGMAGRSGWLVDNLQLSCEPLAGFERAAGKTVALAPVGGGGGGPRAYRRCGNDGLARGLYGRSGSLIDAVGLLCRSEDSARAFPFFATTRTQVSGGTGGGDFNLSCHSDEVLVGISGRAGAWLDKVGALCIKADANGQWASDIMRRGATGGLGNGGSSFASVCPANHAVSGLRIKSGGYVEQLGVRCQPLAAPGVVDGAPSTLPAVGSLGQPNGEAACPARRPAHGLVGRSGLYLDAIGLTCRGNAT